MQGDCQIVLRMHVCKFVDLRNNAAGGNRDVTGTYGQSPVVIHGPDEPHDIFKVVEWFAGAHDDHMGYPFVIAKVLLDRHDLCHHFAAGQITLFLCQA